MDSCGSVSMGKSSCSNNAESDKCPPLGKNGCVKIGESFELLK